MSRIHISYVFSQETMGRTKEKGTSLSKGYITSNGAEWTFFCRERERERKVEGRKKQTPFLGKKKAYFMQSGGGGGGGDNWARWRQAPGPLWNERAPLCGARPQMTSSSFFPSLFLLFFHFLSLKWLTALDCQRVDGSRDRPGTNLSQFVSCLFSFWRGMSQPTCFICSILFAYFLFDYQFRHASNSTRSLLHRNNTEAKEKMLVASLEYSNQDWAISGFR